MNTKTAKTAKDINLSGVAVEFERRDGQVRGIILRDGAGGMLIVRENGYSGVEVLAPAPPKLVARWRVRGQVGETPVDETFTYEHEATSRIAELGMAKTAPEKILVEE